MESYIPAAMPRPGTRIRLLRRWPIPRDPCNLHIRSDQSAHSGINAAGGTNHAVPEMQHFVNLQQTHKAQLDPRKGNLNHDQLVSTSNESA